MKGFKFKDGYQCVASTKEEAMAKHKLATAAFPVEEENVPEFLLVPTDKIVNKGWLLRFKKLRILSENKVAIKKGMKAEKKAMTIQKMIKYIEEDM